jgi:hypothetical protein
MEGDDCMTGSLVTTDHRHLGASISGGVATLVIVSHDGRQRAAQTYQVAQNSSFWNIVMALRLNSEPPNDLGVAVAGEMSLVTSTPTRMWSLSDSGWLIEEGSLQGLGIETVRVDGFMECEARALRCAGINDLRHLHGRQAIAEGPRGTEGTWGYIGQDWGGKTVIYLVKPNEPLQPVSEIDISGLGANSGEKDLVAATMRMGPLPSLTSRLAAQSAAQEHPLEPAQMVEAAQAIVRMPIATRPEVPMRLWVRALAAGARGLLQNHGAHAVVFGGPLVNEAIGDLCAAGLTGLVAVGPHMAKLGTEPLWGTNPVLTAAVGATMEEPKPKP